MPLMRWLSITMLSLLLTACGGGGSIEKSTDGTDNTTDQTGEIVLTIQVADSDGNTLDENNPISQSRTGTVTATLTKGDEPITGKLIQFNLLHAGRLSPETGTGATNSAGIASITIASGENRGWGEVTATYTDSENETHTDKSVFYSSGDEANAQEDSTKLTMKVLADCPASWESQRDTTPLDELALECTATNKIDAIQEVDVLVGVASTKSGLGISGVLVELEADIGTILSGEKSVTDNFGFALFKYRPPLQGGAGQLKASFNDVEAEFAFTSGAEDLSLTIDNGLRKDSDGNTIALGAGETTLLTVEIRDQNGDFVTAPLDVAFSSGCAESDKAQVDGNATSVGGIAYSTYKNLGCDIATGDTVSVTISKGGNSETQQVVIPVSPAKPQAIEFVDASESLLALRGTGGPLRKESSELTFKLINSLSGGAANQRLDFRLRAKHSDATLVPQSVRTDSLGEAKVIVSSGNVSSSFVVQACFIPNELIPSSSNDEVTCWQERFDECTSSSRPDDCPSGVITLVPQDEAIMSVSSRLSVTSGLPVNSTMSLSVETVNTETLSFSNKEVPIVVNVADRYGNFVHDGTKVYISAEGGAVGTVDGTQFNAELECETTDGRCRATWVSQNVIPFVTNKPASDPRSPIDCSQPNQVGCSEKYWGNEIGSFNPKLLYKAKKSYLVGQGNSAPSHQQILNVGNNQLSTIELEATRNCDLYFGSYAPCTYGILDASVHEDGVPLAGRATLIAITDGEENFNDVNGNGLFDENEFSLVYDVPEAFRDDNENGSYEGINCLPNSDSNPCSPLSTNAGHFEKLWDGNGDGSFTDKDRKYNGLSCTVAQQQAGACSKSIIDVFDSAEIIMSGSRAYFRFVVAKDANLANDHTIPQDCSDLVIDGVTALELESSELDGLCDVKEVNFDTSTTIGSVEVFLYFSDINNNPLPKGTEIQVSADNGLYTGGTSYEVSNSSQKSASMIKFSIANEIEANQKAEGEVSIVFTTPAGETTGARLTVRDAG
ncbi:hypothetical protein [Pseudoalteromonas amylolytica]|uniref:Big-1 domain-containing protein n=1 Tax=Pseudoalteromonas amylolytica TaxID=1859457 RepID=A0A1S1MWE3_9GAMM|nr:hypothetical protein [Pseudoalteromonas amylolytica]OHU91198.1 hypothetical protein BET10_10170 [Pseudoalteromonas amylolytica]